MVMDSTVMRKDFWIDQWNELNKMNTAFSGYGSKTTWNAMAANYGKEQHKTDVNDRVQQTIDRLECGGVVLNGSRILDVGCGNGRYARAFARLGAEVICVDVSEKMIGRLQSESEPEELSKITPLVADWKSLDVDSDEFASGFDLVFANMTPAVTDPDSFLKLMRVSNRWCWFRGWAGKRKNPLLERLHQAVNGIKSEPFAGNFNYAWNLVCSCGCFPDNRFETIQWTNRSSLEECIDFYVLFFSHGSAAENGIRGKIEGALSEIAVDGYIENTVTGHTGSMLWSLNGSH